MDDGFPAGLCLLFLVGNIAAMLGIALGIRWVFDITSAEGWVIVILGVFISWMAGINVFGLILTRYCKCKETV